MEQVQLRRTTTIRIVEFAEMVASVLASGNIVHRQDELARG